MYRRIEPKPEIAADEQPEPKIICTCVCGVEEASAEEAPPANSMAVDLRVDYDING